MPYVQPPGITGDEFDAVLECMWRAWADSVEFYGIHDSEVLASLSACSFCRSVNMPMSR